MRPPASEEQISLFESKYGVTLPKDMREYFGAIDGMEMNTSEGELMVSFWQLSRVRPIPEEYSDPSHRASDHYMRVPNPECYFCFADYMIESEVYAIRLSADPSVKNTVIAYEGTEKAESFSDFVRKYLEDPKQLT